MTTTHDAGVPGSADAEQATQTGTGPFMLTLCRLAAPVSIRPPQAPPLKAFKFFTSRVRQSDGSERLYLHMGYFATMADAQKWAQLVRGSYPGAIATPVPAAVLKQPSSGIPTLVPVETPRRAPAAASQHRASSEGQFLARAESARGRAGEPRLDVKDLSDPFQRRIDQALASDQVESTSTPARVEAARYPGAQGAKTSASPTPSGRIASSATRSDRASGELPRQTETFEQTHDLLPSSEIWT